MNGDKESDAKLGEGASVTDEDYGHLELGGKHSGLTIPDGEKRQWDPTETEVKDSQAASAARLRGDSSNSLAASTPWTLDSLLLETRTALLKPNHRTRWLLKSIARAFNLYFLL